MIKVRETLSTDGSGLWSTASKDVDIIGLDLPYVDDEGDYAELRVFFDTSSWDVNKDGLIYTDKKFMGGLITMLEGLGFTDAIRSVNYSEQGMQGKNYVSCDVSSKEFIDHYRQIELVNRI